MIYGSVDLRLSTDEQKYDDIYNENDWLPISAYMLLRIQSKFYALYSSWYCLKGDPVWWETLSFYC